MNFTIDISTGELCRIFRITILLNTSEKKQEKGNLSMTLTRWFQWWSRYVDPPSLNKKLLYTLLEILVSFPGQPWKHG